MAVPPQNPESIPKPDRSEKSPPILVVDNVSIAFGEQQVLRDISFSVMRGETLTILGESGCGKTVLLKLLIGLLFPHKGRVVFDGQTLADLDDRSLTQLRMRFGFLFQGAALFDSLALVAIPKAEIPDAKSCDTRPSI